MTKNIDVKVDIKGGAGGVHLNFLVRTLDVSATSVNQIQLDVGHHTVLVSGNAPSGGSLDLAILDGAKALTSGSYKDPVILDFLPFDVL